MQQKYSNLIKARRSVRTYINKPLSEENMVLINDYINSLSDAPLGVKTRFSILETGNLAQNKIKLGTYGFIRGASTYICAAAKRDEYALESLGYQMEKIILFAQSLGLGTCWLGGTFNRGSFAKALNLQQDEFLPIITPVGVGEQKLRFREKMVRKGSNSDKRKPFESMFFLNNFSTMLHKENAGKYLNALEMVRLAPSASNKQPWLIVVDSKNDVIHFYLNRLNNYTGNKLGFEIQEIDIGIAMCHLELALLDDGIKGEFYKDSPKIKLPEFKNSKASYEISFRIK